MNKKSQVAIRYITFLSLLIAISGVLAHIFLTDLNNKPISLEYSKNRNFVEKILDNISSYIKDVPIIGPTWKLFMATITLDNIHPEVSYILIALFTIPLGYLLLRLIRGGG